MKTPKPSKSEILNELESIRHSLSNELLDEELKTSGMPASHGTHFDEHAHTGVSHLNNASAQDNNQNFDEEDIPVLDDLVIDDDSCPDTIEKIMSKPEQNQRMRYDNTQHEEDQLMQLDTINTNSSFTEDIKDSTKNIKFYKKYENTDPYPDSNDESITETNSSSNINTPTSSALKTSQGKVLPGQRSLFDEDPLDKSSALTNQPAGDNKNSLEDVYESVNKQNRTEESHITNSAEHQPKEKPSSKTTPIRSLSNIEIAEKQIFERDKKRDSDKENPFLPPHIRERLAKQKRVLADDALAHEFALASLKSSASNLNHSSEQNTHDGHSPYYPSNNTIHDGTPDLASKLESHIENNIAIDTSALVQEILQQNSMALTEALQDAKDGLDSSLIQMGENAESNLDSRTTSSTIDSSITNQLLIENLIQQLMPDLEKALREKLKTQMTKDLDPEQTLT